MSNFLKSIFRANHVLLKGSPVWLRLSLLHSNESDHGCITRTADYEPHQAETSLEVVPFEALWYTIVEERKLSLKAQLLRSREQSPWWSEWFPCSCHNMHCRSSRHALKMTLSSIGRSIERNVLHKQKERSSPQERRVPLETHMQGFGKLVLV